MPGVPYVCGCPPAAATRSGSAFFRSAGRSSARIANPIGDKRSFRRAGRGPTHPLTHSPTHPLTHSPTHIPLHRLTQTGLQCNECNAKQRCNETFGKRSRVDLSPEGVAVNSPGWSASRNPRVRCLTFVVPRRGTRDDCPGGAHFRGGVPYRGVPHSDDSHPPPTLNEDHFPNENHFLTHLETGAETGSSVVSTSA